MVDLALCRRHDCPKKKTCYRYIAKADKWQSYILIEDDDTSECEHYWPCPSKGMKKRLDIQHVL